MTSTGEKILNSKELISVAIKSLGIK